MGKYFNSRTRIGSIISAIPVFLLVLLWLNYFEAENALLWAALCGAVAIALFSVLIPVEQYLRDKRYDGIEETLPQPVLLKAGVSIRGKTGTRSGYLYLTEDAMYLYSRDHKPYASQILLKEQVRDLKVEQDVVLSFSYAGSALYALASTQCTEIADTLRRHGWIVDYTS